MAAAKELSCRVRLLIKAGQAKPTPPVGPALGQAGLNIMAFCKEFNAATQDVKDDVPMAALVNAYTDRSFDFTLRSPPASWFIKRAAGIDVAASAAGHEKRAVVSLKHLYEIAKIKRKDPDQQYIDERAWVAQLIGTCRSMGVTVIGRDGLRELAAEQAT